MAEFVRHYLAQGCDHVYIIDNGSTDGGVEGLPGCMDPAIVSVIREPRDFRILLDASGGPGHSRMLTENLFVRLRNETEWAIIVDADEFMFGKNGFSLKSYAQSLPPDVNRVYVFWNIITPPGGYGEDFSLVPEGFHLAQNTRRINYDRFSELGANAQHANGFGKSLFRPRYTDLAEGLWLHKVFVHGRTRTNWHAEDEAEEHRHVDNWPLVTDYSEAAYHRLNVALHHYALRNRADCLKKQAQLTACPFKTPFILGLFDLLQSSSSSSSLGDLLFIADTELVSTPHIPQHMCTMCHSIVGKNVVEAMQCSGGVSTSCSQWQVHIVGWAYSLNCAKRLPIRFFNANMQVLLYRETPATALLLPADAPPDCGWSQILNLQRAANDRGAFGVLQMRVDENWVTFMEIAVQCVYIVVTTSLQGEGEIADPSCREQQYRHGIGALVRMLARYERAGLISRERVKVIVVENNGPRQTFLDDVAASSSYPCVVHYTHNNALPTNNKGHKELRDVHDCLERFNVVDDDLVVKLTGRYVLHDDSEFMRVVLLLMGGVLRPRPDYDAVLRFGNFARLTAEHQGQMGDCITGLIAMKCKFVRQIGVPREDVWESIEWKWAEMTYQMDLERVCALDALGISICPGTNHYYDA